MQRNTAPLARRTGFAPRQKPMARRQQPLAKVSPKHRRQQAAQSKAYAEAEDAGQEYCSVCGAPGPTVHAHLFTQHQREDLRNNPLNWLVMGRWCECHDLQENHKPAFAARYPDAWGRVLHQMQQVDAGAFAAWVALHPELF